MRFASSSAPVISPRKGLWAQWSFLIIILILLGNQPVSCWTTIPRRNIVNKWVDDLSIGYQQRVAADPSFPLKSCAEVVLAFGTQLAAEWQRRGVERLMPEIDFVSAGILTAIFGKYISMWKVAKTTRPIRAAPDQGGGDESKERLVQPTLGNMPVPTNAFQTFLLDGMTRPTLKQRFGSLIVPAVPLFRAGFVASFVGYGFVAVMIWLRTWLAPSYVAETKNINVLYASLYTGSFMATISNVRFQLLQGVVEPAIDHLLRPVPLLRAAAIFLVRVVNGFIGSLLAVTGMRLCGLQRLK